MPFNLFNNKKTVYNVIKYNISDKMDQLRRFAYLYDKKVVLVNKI